MFFQAEHTAPVGINDLFYAIIFIIAIIMIASSKKSKMLKIPGNEHYKYYMYNIYFKLFFALAYGAVYMFYYQGGDTMAYWKGAEKLNNLLWESPLTFWDEFISAPSEENIILRFTPETGYPPIWIYRDPGSFFVSKIFTLFMTFIGQSYTILTLLMGYLTALASWKLYELVRYYKITNDFLAAIAILFAPSVSFWCAGISKDTVVLISVFVMLYHVFSLANGIAKKKWLSYTIILVLGFVLLNTRTFMLFTVVAPTALALLTRVVKKYEESIVIANFMRLLIISAGILGFLFFIRSQGEEFAKAADKVLAEAQLQQQDFANNESYGDKRYDLGITDFSPFGMVKIAPQAILTAIYRPGLWEARTPLLFVSGLETALFLLLTAMFIFKGSLSKKIKAIQKNEFLVFSFVFALILAFFAGFTSGLFGVLVRFKAPLLPFILLVFTANPKFLEEIQESESKKQLKAEKVD